MLGAGGEILDSKQEGTPERNRFDFHVYVEFLLAALILVAIYKLIIFFHFEGYLPSPFWDDVSDTFMDWYNTVYWGYRHGTYDEWFSIYPPFTFIFMKIFSNPSCYTESSPIGRECDPLGAWVITGFAALNCILVYLDYRKMDSRTALPRAVAVGLGTSALFGVERGNVIVACFTFFILAHGRTLRSTWLRWICFGITANLKPYLILSVLGRVLHRKWRWAEGCAIACVLIYAASFMILGRGSPFDLISDIFIFSGTPEKVTLDYMEYATTYNSTLDLIKTQLPLMFYLGSKPLELAEHFVPWVIGLGTLGVLVCFAGAVLRPTKISTYRLGAMTMILLLTTSRGVGGYAGVFLMFFVFFEKWESVGQAVALVAAYVVSVPWDYMLVKIIHVDEDSWLSGRRVSFDFGLTYGGVLRPALLLAIEYGLVATSLMDLSGLRRRRPDLRASVTPSGPDHGVGVAVN
jgi:hypothetical protein